jgi:hypothetical protein
MSQLGRYLVDYENPDAGIGHSLGHVNNAIKICIRHGLTFAYAPAQVRKSSDASLRWRVKQLVRKLTLRQVYETHNIGDDINTLFAFEQYSTPRADVEKKIKGGALRRISLPPTDIQIPSNDQQDDVVYREVDAAIKAHPEDGAVFVMPHKRTGDFEYEASRGWFRQCFFAVPENKKLTVGPSSNPESELRVAVHIRRGDLLPGRQFDDLSKRMLPDAWYLQILEKIVSATSRPVSISIVSEGIGGQYCSENGQRFNWHSVSELKNCSIVEYIDRPFVDSFRLLVNADILIGSKSGMTHLAGLLGDQIKLVPKMWHSYRGASGVIELGDTISTEELDAADRIVATYLG